MLRLFAILAAAAALLFAVPGLFSLETTNTAIIKITDKIDAASLSARYGVILLDSIPELHKYLMRGDAANLAKLSKDADVVSIEYDLITEISERAMLNESTVALLDPSTVALLDGQNKLWD